MIEIVIEIWNGMSWKVRNCRMEDCDSDWFVLRKLTPIEAGKHWEFIMWIHLFAEVRPWADGGEGTVEALVAGMNGTVEGNYSDRSIWRTSQLCMVLSRHNDGSHEMSAAAGIHSFVNKLTCLLQQLTVKWDHDAIQKGCRRFIVGIGSATMMVE